MPLCHAPKVHTYMDLLGGAIPSVKLSVPESIIIKNFIVSPILSEINFTFLELSVLISIWIYTGFKEGEGLGGSFFL